jgi:hypothetical protein
VSTRVADPFYPSFAPYGGFYGGFYGDPNERFFRNSVRNEFLGDTLDTFIPGTGGVFSAVNDVNLLRRAPDFFDSTISGRGYRRDPLGSFIRNDFFSGRIGKFLPGASASLNAFNRLNLLASLL